MDTPTKLCVRCGIEYPATPEYFHRHKQRADGLYSWCKPCANEGRKRYYLRNKAKVIERQRDYDQHHLDEKHERNRQWREINKAKVRQNYQEYRQQNRDKLIDYMRNYYQTNRDRLNKQSRKYYRRTRPLRLRYAKNYRQENREQRAILMRAYYRSNRERMLLHQRVRGMKKRAGPGVSIGDIEAQYSAQQGHCYWCSCQLDGTYHVDHVIPLARNGAHASSNIVISCPFCNMSKGSRLPYKEWTPPNPLKPIKDR